MEVIFMVLAFIFLLMIVYRNAEIMEKNVAKQIRASQELV